MTLNLTHKQNHIIKKHSVNEESDIKPETGYSFSDSSYRTYC